MLFRSGIHPIITVRDHKVDSVDKVRGAKACCPALLNRMKTEGVDENYAICIGHANTTSKLETCKDLITAEYKNELHETMLGPVIGTHLGPNTIIVAYIQK